MTTAGAINLFGGNIKLNAGLTTTASNISLNGPVKVGANGVTLTSAGNITFTGDVTPDTNATRSLGLTANSGTIQWATNLGSSALMFTDLNLSASNLAANASTTLFASNDILVNADITKSSGADSTLTFKAGRHVSFGAATDISSTSNKLNLLFHADTDKSGDGFIKFSGPSITTNGGSVQFGVGDTAVLNSATVYVGGDVYFDGSVAQTVATNAGNFTVWGETLVANAAGLTLNSGGGNVLFKGVLNSANQYVGVNSASGLSWIQANTAATGVANSYLATITSRLENSLAALAGNYTTAWIGGRRQSDGTWRWAAGPEAGQAFTYTNWASGEPNNCCAGTLNGLNYGGENASQFTGTNGNWNDLFDNGARGATDLLNNYIRETTINAEIGRAHV